MAKKLVIDEEECIGCESCVELCPAAFVFDDGETKAYVKEGAEQCEEDCVDEAIASCPSECIFWEED